jgi:ligand-binding SRPBCC domain-containing protein
MSLHRLERKLELPISLDQAWKFFSNPGNLKMITPPSLGLAVTDIPGEKIYPGMIINYRVRPILRLPWNWVTEITHVNAPFMFVDEQRTGPYRLWHHEHHFQEIAGGVEIRDLVHYILPLGILGDVINTLRVENDLRLIFDYREEVLNKMFKPVNRSL